MAVVDKHKAPPEVIMERYEYIYVSITRRGVRLLTGYLEVVRFEMICTILYLHK
jgi:hypothetical protein